MSYDGVINIRAQASALMVHGALFAIPHLSSQTNIHTCSDTTIEVQKPNLNTTLSFYPHCFPFNSNYYGRSMRRLLKFSETPTLFLLLPLPLTRAPRLLNAAARGYIYRNVVLGSAAMPMPGDLC
jgi:hypothetical protein